jgi:hypothetical protein
VIGKETATRKDDDSETFFHKRSTISHPFYMTPLILSATEEQSGDADDDATELLLL